MAGTLLPATLFDAVPLSQMPESAPDRQTRGSGVKLSQYVEFPWQGTPDSLGWNLAAGGLSGPGRRSRPTFGPETAWRGTPLEAGGRGPRGHRTRHRSQNEEIRRTNREYL
jgi:hypothetical protein